MIVTPKMVRIGLLGFQEVKKKHCLDMTDDIQRATMKEDQLQ